MMECKNLKKLKRIMLSKERSEHKEDFKCRFRLFGLKAMNELAGLLELREYRVFFNPGGISVSGDLYLMGMWREENGVYVHVNKTFPRNSWKDVLYREIKHMKDYTGGANKWFKYELLGDPDGLRVEILPLRKARRPDVNCGELAVRHGSGGHRGSRFQV